MALSELEGARVHDGEHPDRYVAFERLVDSHVTEGVAVYVVGPSTLSGDALIDELVGSSVMVSDDHGNEVRGTLDAFDEVSAGLRLRILLAEAPPT